MKTATCLTMTALSALLLVAANITTPAEAAKVRALSLQVKPKVTIRPRINVRPRVRVNVNTQRLITRGTNIRETPPTNDANLPRQQTPPAPGKRPSDPAPTNTAATPGTSEDPSSNGLTTPSNAPQQTGPAKTVDPNTVPLPRAKPSRIAGLDPEKIEDLGAANEWHDFFLTLRELEMLKNANLFGNEDGSTAGDYNEFSVGLADNLPDGVSPTEPTNTTEAAPEHSALFNTDIPTLGTGGTATPPDDGGAERHPGGNRPGQGRYRSDNTKIDLSGRNGPASDGTYPNILQTLRSGQVTGRTDSESTSPGRVTTLITVLKLKNGDKVTYTSIADEHPATIGTENDATDGGDVVVERRDDNSGHNVADRYEWNDESGQFEHAGMTFTEVQPPAGDSQPAPHDGASHTEDVSGLCGTVIPAYICARGVNSTASPEEMTTQPAEDGSGNRIKVTRLGQGVVTDTGDAGFQTPSGATPHSEAAEDDGSIRPGPLPDCISCTPNR